jgi:hypothetical protein
MADPKVDELFGQGGGAPSPRVGWIYTMLASGMLLALAGMACTSAPGGLLVLGAWLLVEQESDRLESGYLPSDAAPALARARSRTWVGLVTVVVLFTVQAFLLCTTHFYESLYEIYVEGLAAIVQVPPPPPPAP